MGIRTIIATALPILCLPFARAQSPAATPTSPTNNTTAAPITQPARTPSTNAPYKIPENRIIEFLVPLSSAGKVAVANSKNPPVDVAKAAIAMPSGFEPEIPTPIMIVCGTSDGEGSSIRAMHAFTNIALRLGWMVIAADGPAGKPPQDNPPYRWTMISTLLDHIHKTWPNSRRWPIISAGVSGGGKWAGVLGAILSQKGYNLIGVFMGAVNQDYASEAAKIYDPATRFKEVPIYLSSGADDKLATPEHHEAVKESLLHNGFTHVRLERFSPGGHALSEAELRKALSWFIEFYGKDSIDIK